MRKLAAGCLAFAGGILIAVYCAERFFSLLLSGICILGFLITVCFPAGKHTRILRITLITLALGLSFFTASAALTENTASRIQAGVAEHEALVLDYPEKLDETNRICVLVIHPSVRYKAWLYDRYGMIETLHPGDQIRFYASFEHRDDDGVRSYDSNLSKGILAAGTLRSPVNVLKTGRGFLFPFRLLSRFIRESIPKIFDGRSAVFLKALIIGDKRELYEDDGVYSALLRSGFMHTVAVSGMHVSYVAGLCLLLFGGRRKGAFLSILIIWGFVITAGSTPSSMRAGIMQTIFLMAPIFRRENDPLTALSFALAMILLFNPYSAESIGLQLSFASTLGIILFSSRIQQDLLSGVSSEKIRRILRYPVAVLSSSIGVSVITIPLCAIHFGYVSVLSVLTNLAAIWAVPLCFCGAFVCVFISLISPGLAIIVGKAVGFISRFILAVCSAVARIPFAVIPAEGPFVLILFFLCYAVFAIFAFSAFTGRQKIVIPIVLSTLFTALYFAYYAVSGASVHAKIAVLDVGQGECVVALAGNRSLVVDCGSSDYTVHAGEYCAEYLFIHGHRNLDSLVLTHLHEDHINGACALMQTIPVKNLFLPVNIDRKSEAYGLLCEYARNNSTRVYLVDTDARIVSGDLDYDFIPSLIYTEENESCMSVLLRTAGKSFLITGDSPYVNELQLLKNPVIGDVDVLVAGHHGANNSSCTLFLQQIRPEYSVISVGQGNAYGHPSVFALSRMLAEGCRIYRTDLNGTVSFIVY